MVERVTDYYIEGLLKESNIKYEPEKTSIKEIQEALNKASKKGTGNQGFPEFIAKVKDFLLIIEDKAKTSMNELYVDEKGQILDNSINAIVNYAVNGAVHYSRIINKETTYKKIFAFGCSGDEKKHIIRPVFIKNENEYEILPEVENFENFSEDKINDYYNEFVLKKTPDEFLEINLEKEAQNLHTYLRNYGQLGETEKPIIVSALLLALSENLLPKDLKGDSIDTDGKLIYNKVETKLKRSNVPEDRREKILTQFLILKNREILNRKNPEIEETPLRYFMRKVEKIYSEIKNSKIDILGRFYGEFVSYSGGDGQSLGIVLTPTHITELFTELLDIKPSDNIFDPCCGTGSFLISGMHRMLCLAKNEDEKKEIKEHKIHGIEIREEMFTLATTNMILRGDGKSNLKLADFFDEKVEELQKDNYTVGMMNPPYSQGSSDHPQLYEINFIKHLLDSMAKNGRCATIVPQPTMIGNIDEIKRIKKEILKKHTLEGVITLQKDTFYRIGVNACIAIFTAHQPHPENKRCKFINFIDDGYELRPHIGIIETSRAKERKEYLLKCWRDEIDVDSKFMVKAKIKSDDEWLHSYYYFDDEIPDESDFSEAIGKYMGFEFSMFMQNNYSIFNEDD